MLHVGIHNGDIGCGSRQCAFDAGRREATAAQSAARSALADRAGQSRGYSEVQSGESSTKITSQLTVWSTASSNSRSGPILALSLRVGMTTVNSGPSIAARAWT